MIEYFTFITKSATLLATLQTRNKYLKTKKPQFFLNYGFLRAGPTRLELATSCVTGRRSNQLNYDPFFQKSIAKLKDTSEKLAHKNSNILLSKQAEL